MKILIAGGSGFLGQAMTGCFREQGHELILLSRSPGAGRASWDGCTLGDWCEVLERADVLVNLAGKSVDCRYTAANREEILNSRIRATEILGHAVRLTPQFGNL